jgi:hypothetical protein
VAIVTLLVLQQVENRPHYYQEADNIQPNEDGEPVALFPAITAGSIALWLWYEGWPTRNSEFKDRRDDHKEANEEKLDDKVTDG